MLRYSLIPIALVLTFTITAQSMDTLLLSFPLSEHLLSEQQQRHLKKWCSALPLEHIDRLEISGHSDIRGNATYNEQLSLSRAMAVRDLLKECTSESFAMEVLWRGSHAPRSAGKTEKDHAMDRRVEVVAHLQVPYAAQGSSGVQGVTYTPEAMHKHAQVKPLMPLLNKPQEHFQVSANKPIQFTASDGTTVRIPANALQNAQGGLITGEVDITYRSFHEAYGIIASGIPMHIAMDGIVEHFETAGMYELYASQNGEAVSLAAGGGIALERPAGPALAEDFAGWQLNEASGAWESAGTLEQQAPVSTEAWRESGSEATRIYWRKLTDIRFRSAPDSTLFDNRRNSDAYCGTQPCPDGLRDESAKVRKWASRQLSDQSLQVIGHKGIYDPDRVVFEVVIPDRRVFPEWNRMPQKPVWEYVGPESRRVFKRLYGRRHNYQDIDLVMQPGEAHGVIRLKENGEWLELAVSTAWNRDTPARSARWDRSLVAYHKGLAKRRAEFDRGLERTISAYKGEQANAVRDSWQLARRKMVKRERTFDLRAWQAYADSFPLASSERMALASNNAFATIRTTFNLTGFGIYNIDRIMKMPNREELFVTAVDEEGKPFEWSIGYAVLTGENSVITYWSNGRTAQGTPMLVSPGRMKSLFLVDAEGRIMQMESAGLNQRRQLTVKLRGRLLAEPRDLQELRAQVEP